MNTLRFSPRRALCLLILSASLLQVASAQINVTPTRLFLSPSSRSQDIIIINPGTQPVVVTARTYFAVLRNDTAGAVREDTVLTGHPMERSVLQWVRIFPRQFTLEPGGRRTLKVMVTPPGDLPDGEYFARVHIRGIGVDRPTIGRIDTLGIGTSLNLNLAYSLPIFYRKGKLQTGVVMEPKRVSSVDGKHSVLLGIRTIGNAVFRGTLRMRLIRFDGQEVVKKDLPLVAEVGYDMPLELPVVPPGSYTVKLEALTELPGKANETVVKSPPSISDFAIAVGEHDVQLATTR